MLKQLIPEVLQSITLSHSLHRFEQVISLGAGTCELLERGFGVRYLRYKFLSLSLQSFTSFSLWNIFKSLETAFASAEVLFEIQKKLLVSGIVLDMLNVSSLQIDKILKSLDLRS